MTVEGEVEGKARPGRRKTGWIDNVECWTEGGMATAREKAHKRMPTVPYDYGDTTSTTYKIKGIFK